MMIVRGAVFDCGTDYLTATETYDPQERLGSINYLAEHLSSYTKDFKPVDWGGYTGWAKRGMRFGQRTRGGLVDKILNASGSLAKKATEFPMGEGREFNVTRLDVQMTVKLETPDANLVRRYYELMACDASYKRAMTGKLTLTYYENEYGQTLYFGKRTSRAMYIRIYDKGFELGYPRGHVWRFEVELKRTKAPGAFDALVNTSDQMATSKSIVGTIFETNCGVLLPYSGQLLLPVDGNLPSGSMSWLSRCVKPVVVGAINGGRVDEVLAALGLEWVTDVDQITRDKINKLVREEVDRIFNHQAG